MWRDFFYYSKGERRAVYVLLILIALLLVGIVMVPEPFGLLEPEVAKVDSVALRQFESKVLAKRSVRKNYDAPVVQKTPASLFLFDPNLADSIELSRLGLPPFVVRNVMKYRQKGGRFATASSFARIYGLTEEKFKELEPYIRIAEVAVPKPRKTDTVVKSREVEKKVFKYPEGTLVDVNRADTAELKKIPGIGSGIAKAIVGYRSRLGGFCSLEQLEEIEYVTPSLMKWFKLEEPVLSPLKINSAGLDKLRAHPYINFYQAKVIVEHRKKRGPIKNLSQLALYEEFTEKDLKRLSAYFSFD